MLFENVDRGQLAAMGDVRRPSIADLFVAVMSNSQNLESGNRIPETR
jgi:hypothetical protein